jgi:putative endopeptidase
MNNAEKKKLCLSLMNAENSIEVVSILKENTWLTHSTRDYAIKKLQSIDMVIGSAKKLKEDPLLGYESDNSWGNMEKIYEWRKKRWISLEGKRGIIDFPDVDWSTLKLVGTQNYLVNAFYIPSRNMIFIPLAYIQKPFIDLEERGIEYNLAFMGNTISHELAHSLDVSGSKYDAKGRLINWWKKHDSIKYDKIVKKIKNHYQFFGKRDGVNLNVENSIGEDGADISALYIGEKFLEYFQNINDYSDIIKRLSFETFYVYMAIQSKQFLTKKGREIQLKTNPHTPEKFRVNVPLSRSLIFKTIFNIQKGDGMYWHDNTPIW